MTLTDIKTHLKLLLTNDIGKALEQLKSVTKDNDLFNTVILQQGTYNGLKKNMQNGITSEANANQQMNRLRYNFTQIIDDIEEEQIIIEKATQLFQKSNAPSSDDNNISHNNTPTNSTSDIYISYAWGGDSEKIVDQLDKELQAKGIKVTRDKRDLGYKGSIVGFMEDIGKGNKIIVVISEKYLKSENCMFELTQIYENKDFAKRIFPIILEDSKIYSPVSRISYIKYWNDKITELDEAIKSAGTSLNMTEVQKELNNYGDIRASFDKMAFVLKDMNALTPEMHKNQNFQTLYDELTS